jgi:hypothetical protein
VPLIANSQVITGIGAITPLVRLLHEESTKAQGKAALLSREHGDEVSAPHGL